jgi:hypothetical protein
VTSWLPVVEDDELDESGVLPGVPVDVLPDALADDDGLFAGLVDVVDT